MHGQDISECKLLFGSLDYKRPLTAPQDSACQESIADSVLIELEGLARAPPLVQKSHASLMWNEEFRGRHTCSIYVPGATS